MVTRTTTIEIRIVETFTGFTGAAPEPQSFDSEAEFADWLNNNPAVEGEAGWTDYLHLHTDFDEIAVYTSRLRRLSDVEAGVRYFLEGVFAGECYGAVAPESLDGWGRVFIIRADSTKSQRDDWTGHMDDLWRILQEGSPVRKTDRSGPRGTQAVQALGCDFWVAFR